MTNTQSSAEDFYKKVLDIIVESNIPFMIGGGIAVCEYTGIARLTKDLDIFCKAGDCPKIVNILGRSGLKVRILDERWLAQALETKYYVDILFSSPNYLVTVDDSWFIYSQKTRLFGHQVKLIAPEELIWCKAYIQDRDHYDGADINHLFLKLGKQIDWRRLLNRMESHWEVLLSFLINFRFVYPSERTVIPRWLMEELLSRLKYQIGNPTPIDKICRGPLLSRVQYKIDIEKFGFETMS